MALELSDTNLYSTGRIIVFKDGREKLVRDKLKLEPSKTDEYYTIMPGDMLDELAWRHYRDFVEKAWTCWWIIADLNKVRNPLYMAPYVGQEFVIPNIQRVLLKLS